MASWRDAPVVGQGEQQQPAWQAAPTVEQAPVAQRPREAAMAPQQMGEGPGAPVPPQTTDVQPTSRLQEDLTAGEVGSRAVAGGVGTAEAVGTMASGGIAEVLAGLAGIEELAMGGDDRVERAAERIRQVQDLRTFQPKTETGKQILEGLGMPFQGLGRAADTAGGATLEATGSPLAATAVSTAMEAVPGLAGARTGRPGRGQRREDVKRVSEGARELGVDLNTGVTPQREQLLGAAEREASGGVTDDMGRPVVGERGQSMEGVQAGVRARADEARDRKNQMYEQAKQGDAAVELDDAVGLADRLQSVRKDYLTEEMPQARRLLGEVEQLKQIQKRRDKLIKEGGQPKDIAVTINQFEEWGQKIRRNQPNQRTDPAQYAAMERMLRTKDEFMDEMFNADMISGDPDAIAAWRRARAANTNYKERFSDNKVIRDMVEMDAEPTTVRKWIFGANAAGAKSEAASVVRRIKSELGEDSPQFAALRHDAVLDVLDPILGPDPNFKGFVRKYDNMVRSNPPLARDLYGENLEGLRNLRDLVQAHRERPTIAISEMPGGARILGVAAFGHELARKALTVKAASTGATMLARTTTPSPRRRMMGSILGYDPFAPMFGKGSAAALGASQELMNPQEEQPPGGQQPGVLDSMSSSARGALQGLRGAP